MKNDAFPPSPTIILRFFSDLRRCGDGAMFFQKFTIFLVFMMSTPLAYGRFEPGDRVSQRKKMGAQPPSCDTARQASNKNKGGAQPPSAASKRRRTSRVCSL